MESMGTEAAQVVLLSMRNMDKLLEPSSEKQRYLGKKIVNSQVMHLSFGERSDLVSGQNDVQAPDSLRCQQPPMCPLGSKL